MKDEKSLTRDEARAAGLKKYFTGAACKRGHASGRYVSTDNCCDCRAQHTTKWRKKNPEKQPNYLKEWHKKNKQKQAEHARRWREANPGAQSEISKRWRERNPEAQAEHARRWREANPEKEAEFRSARRARERNVLGSHTAEDISRIKALQKGRCACCKKKAKLTVDHIVPLIRGGSNFASNIQMLCGPCNSRKSGKDPLVFMKNLGMLL